MAAPMVFRFTIENAKAAKALAAAMLAGPQGIAIRSKAHRFEAERAMMRTLKVSYINGISEELPNVVSWDHSGPVLHIKFLNGRECAIPWQMIVSVIASEPTPQPSAYSNPIPLN